MHRPTQPPPKKSFFVTQRHQGRQYKELRQLAVKIDERFHDLGDWCEVRKREVPDPDVWAGIEVREAVHPRLVQARLLGPGCRQVYAPSTVVERKRHVNAKVRLLLFPLTFIRKRIAPR